MQKIEFFGHFSPFKLQSSNEDQNQKSFQIVKFFRLLGVITPTFWFEIHDKKFKMSHMFWKTFSIILAKFLRDLTENFRSLKTNPNFTSDKALQKQVRMLHGEELDGA